MTSFVVLDTSFLLNLIDNNDPFHEDAVLLFNELKARKNLQVLIPPLVIYEVIVTLRRKGVRAKTIEAIVMHLVSLTYVSVLSLSEMSAFKHAQHALNDQDQGSAMRTNDFMIFCVGREFSALIITFDVGMYKKCKKVYRHVFFPADKEGHEDDTALILIQIDIDAGEDIGADDYSPFKA